MKKSLCLLLINLLCISTVFGDSLQEKETLLTHAVYLAGGEEHQSLDSAYAVLQAQVDKTVPFGAGTISHKLQNLRPFINASNPTYNGVAKAYETDRYTCIHSDCYTENGPAIYTAQKCPEVTIGNPYTQVASGTGLARTLNCVRYIPIDKTNKDCPKAGNPILIATGEKIQIETDYQSKDGVLEFIRTYRSQRGLSSSVTTASLIDNTDLQFISKQCLSGWYTENTTNPKRIPYCFKYVTSPPSVDVPNYVVRLASGRTLKFNGPSSAIKIQGATHDTLVKNTTTQGSVEWELTREDSTKDFFDVNGKLIRSLLPSGKTRRYSYSDASTPSSIAPEEGMLIAITDGLGRKLQFEYNTNLQLTKMMDPGGNAFSYAYDDRNNLTSVIYPTGKTRQYRFAEASNINNGLACSGSQTAFSKLLTGIIDERGVRYADFKYECSTKAISTEHAGGAEKTLVTFNSDGSITVTNALSKQTIYRFTDIAGAKQIISVEGQPTVSCAGANKAFTYTPEGWLKSKTDWKGVQTTYSYNNLGQEISRTEAFGTPEARTTTTEWHPTLYVKTKVTEPNKETVYNYDANGLLLNQATTSLIVQ